MCGKDPTVYKVWRRRLSTGHDDSGAVIRNFEVIGEAVKRVPDPYRTVHPEIPWRLMAGFRDVLIHGYEGVDLKRVWLAATT